MIWFVLIAGAVAEPSLTLAGAVREALAHSPQLEAQRVQTDLSANDRWRRFLFNEPSLTYSANDYTSQIQYGLTLPVSFPGKSFALTTLDRAKYRAQSAESTARRHDVATNVAAAYLGCATARANQTVQSQTVDDLEEVFRSLRSLYESGHSTQAEKIGAELQSRQARSDLEVAKFREINGCRKFGDLWKIESGRDPGAFELDLPDDIDADVVAELGSRTADEARATAAADLARATHSTATWSQLPDVTLGVYRNDYRFFAASPNFTRWTTSFSVSVTVPIFFPFAEGAEIARAKSRARLDENDAYVKRVGALSDVAEARREYIHARARLAELRQKDLTLGQALAESTSAAYRQGRLGFAELVLSRKTLADLRQQDIQLRGTIIDAHLRCLDQCNEVKQ